LISAPKLVDLEKCNRHVSLIGIAGIYKYFFIYEKIAVELSVANYAWRWPHSSHWLIFIFLEVSFS